ncbi:MAG: PLP-dependent aminotransferase family protein [Oscillospiraceae bacterium]|nr:PLP-dependent aminotransferase family protein [Oscillospiraceae bacterium]
MNVYSDRIKNLKPSAIREIFKFTADPTVIAFSAGNPSPEVFPVEKIARITADIFHENPIFALQYSVTEGCPKLRELLKKDLEEKGVFVPSNDDLIVTAGAQQVMELSTKVICNEGETIICENPSFIGSLNSFRSYNAKLVGIDMDDEGMLPEKLEAALKSNPRTAFIYIIPNFHNPTGKTTSLQRRKDILALAYKYNVIILEDNPYGDIRFAGADVPSIKSMDKKGHVIYAGTFSKTIAPGLRVGYMCAPEGIVQKSIAAMQCSTVHTNILAQMIAYRFVTETNMEEYLDGLRQTYKRKRDLMLNSLKFSFPVEVKFTEPEGGLFIWGTLPIGYGGEDVSEFVRKALQNKVAVVPGNAFSIDESEKSLSFRMTYATPTDEQIEKGVELLASAFKGCG